MSSKINHLSHVLNIKAAQLGIKSDAMSYEDYKYLSSYSYPIVTINENWEVMLFQSFSMPPMIARVGHRHATDFKIVGHHGPVGCNCKVPDEIMVLIELECWGSGATIVLGETYQPV